MDASVPSSSNRHARRELEQHLEQKPEAGRLDFILRRTHQRQKLQALRAGAFQVRRFEVSLLREHGLEALAL